MEISRQIRKFRLESKLSQEELVAEVYVTRQTVSNWENNRSYPDIHSLVLLSTLFGVSLDILVKGDLEEMREKVGAPEKQRFKRDGFIFTILLVAVVVTVAPLFLFLERIGIVIWLMVCAVMMYYAIRIEKQKKAYNITTYMEILKFMEEKEKNE